MKRIRRLFTCLVIVLVVACVVLAVGSVGFVRRSWPTLGGAVQAPGLSAPVEIIRDRWGVPNLYAQNEHDLFFAQGYVHAQDRLVQMDVLRRLSDGTMSQAFGQATVGVDYFMRTIGTRRVADQLWAQMDSDDRSILQAYADGINAYVDSHRNRLPVDFAVMGVDFRPWTPIDTLTFGNATAFWMSSNYRMELLRAQIIAAFGADVAEQLLPTSQDAPLVIPDSVGLYEWMQGVRFMGIEKLGTWNRRAGSNGWVLSSSRTTTGGPILANDTHLGATMPSSWYENGLHGGRFDVVGFSFPGVPLVIVGHNGHIAWGETTLYPDNTDFYLEKLDDAQNPTRYEFMGQWYDLEVLHETIEVKRGTPIDAEILLTRHGPILNSALEAISGQTQSEQPMSMRWTLYEGNHLFQSLVKLNLAENWDQFQSALSIWDLPGLNFVYADTHGNIGYQAAGKVPIREASHQGTIPVPGWSGEYEWQGFVPSGQMPAELNPREGYLVTANNKVVNDDYPYNITHDWFPGYRAKRIIDLLSAKERLNIEDAQRIQADTYSLPAEAIRPYMLAIEPANEQQASAINLLKTWDLNVETDRVGASIYEAWIVFTMQNMIVGSLGDGLGGWYLSGNYELQTAQAMPVLIELMTEPNNPLWDDTRTPTTETRDAVLQKSLSDALDWLTKHYGANPEDWKWGRLHTISFAHNAFGRSGIAPLERLFNSRTIAARGDQFTVDAADFSWADPFAMTQGVAQRMIIDMTNLDSSLSIVSTGQSEQLFSEHREDLLQMWQNVEYHPMAFTRSAVDQQKKSVLTLTP